MDLKAKYLLDICSDPIEFLRQLRQTTEPIGGDTEYSEDGELVEYDVAIEAVKKANDVFIEKAQDFFRQSHHLFSLDGNEIDYFIEDFRNYMKGE